MRRLRRWVARLAVTYRARAAWIRDATGTETAPHGRPRTSAGAWYGWLAVLVVSLLLTLGFVLEADQRAEQPRWEWRFMQNGVFRAWRMHDVEPGPLPTNLVQLFTRFNSDLTWLAQAERRFRQFGRQAGFSNSIIEKYAFPPPGLRVETRWGPGELMLVQVQPLPVRGGPARHLAVVKTGEGDFPTDVREDRLRDVLREAGLRELPVPQGPPVDARYKGTSWFAHVWHRLPALPLAGVFAGLSIVAGLRFWLLCYDLDGWRAWWALGWAGWLFFLYRMLIIITGVLLYCWIPGQDLGNDHRVLLSLAVTGSVIFLPLVLLLSLLLWRVEAPLSRWIVGLGVLAAVWSLYMPALAKN